MCVDVIVALDHASLSGQSNPPVSPGVILLADFVLTVIVVIFILNLPVELVVRNMRLFLHHLQREIILVSININ